MLVSEYVLQIIEKRPYKYSTKLTNVADVKRLGIWDMDTSWRIETLSSAPSGAHVRNIFDTWINAKNSALKKMFDKNISPDLV